MTEYITEIQRQLVESYGFPEGENGCPQGVQDGAYPMIVDKELDLVMVIGGTICCCNFISTAEGLRDFQDGIRSKNLGMSTRSTTTS